MKRATAHRDVALPAAALAALGEALRIEAGPLTAVRGLNAAGYSAGGSLSEGLAGVLGARPEGGASASFWNALSRFFEHRGWGRLEHSAPHPGVGLLTSRDWAEAEGGETAQPSCAFTVGLLSHMLTRVADAPVSVLEVGCRAAGAEACTFAFGSAATIDALYARLIDGASMERALEAL